MTATTMETDAHETTARRDEAAAGLIALAIIGFFAGATAIWGAVGLAMAALTMVPVIYIVLLLITVGK